VHFTPTPSQQRVSYIVTIPKSSANLIVVVKGKGHPAKGRGGPRGSG
jgi:hypothetical protein